MRRFYPLLAAFVILLILVGAYFALFYKKHNVQLKMSPTVANVKLTNGIILKQGDFYLKPGSYIATVSYNGFETKKIPFTVKQTGTTDLMFILIPDSQTGYDYLNQNPNEQSSREQLGDTQFQQNSDAQQTAAPIIKDLPHIERYFRIDYGKSEAHPLDDTAIGIYITLYNESGKQQALDWITAQGYDPSKLELIYNDQSANLSDPDS